MKASVFVPAHAAATEDIAELAAYNAAKVTEIAEKILTICAEPLNFETLLRTA